MHRQLGSHVLYNPNPDKATESSLPLEDMTHGEQFIRLVHLGFLTP